MSTREAMSHAALGWVKPELDQTLLQMRQQIQDYVEEPGNGQPMLQAAAWLHQVQGTLRMVELYAPALVAEELELLAHAVHQGAVADTEEACAVLMRGTVLLPDYLERLQDGHRDIPIVLLPLLNEIRAARGAEGLNESVLLAFGPEASDVSAEELEHARGSLAGRNRELLSTVGGVVKEELLRIKDALDLHLRTGAPSSALQTQVNQLGAVADTLAMMGLDGARELVLGQRTALVEVVEKQSNIDEDLLLEIAGALLYVDASLDEQVASLGSLGRREEDPAALETQRTVEVLAAEAITNFAHAREHFVAFIETNWDHSRLADVPRLLGDVAGALRILEMDEPAQYVTGVQRYIQTELIGRLRVPSGRQLDTLADAMASLEYFLEGVRERRPGGAEILEISRSSLQALRYWPLPDAQDAAAPAPSLVPQAVVPAAASSGVAAVPGLEAIAAADLELPVDAEVEVEAEAEAEAEAETEVLLAAATQVAGGVAVSASPLPPADDYPYVFAASHQVPHNSHSPFDPVNAEREAFDVVTEEAVNVLPLELEDTADGLSPSLAGQAQFHHFDPLLAEQSAAATAEPLAIAPLDGALLVDDLQALEPGDELPAYSGRGQAVEDELRAAELPAVADSDSEQVEASLDAGASVIIPQALDWNAEEAAFFSSLDDSALDLPSAAVAAPPPAEAAPVAVSNQDGFQDNGQLVDADTLEIREVFLEEFDEELANLRAMLPAWAANPGQAELLLPVRRIFHTLKGSGRLVGARTLGEFSWAIESMLNRVRDGLRPASPAVVAMVTLAVDEVLPQLYAALQAGKPVTADLMAIQGVADRIAAGEEIHYIPAARAQTASVDAAETLVMPELEAEPLLPVVEGTPAQVDSVLLDILQAEVTTHLATLHAWLAACEQQPQPVDESLLRAVHTMSGAFAMTEVPEITAVTGPGESLVKRLLATARAPSMAAIAALSGAAQAISQTLQALQAEHPLIPRFSALSAQLQAQVDLLPEARNPLIGSDEGWENEQALSSMPDLSAEPLADALVVDHSASLVVGDMSAYIDDSGLQLPDFSAIDAMVTAAGQELLASSQAPELVAGPSDAAEPVLTQEPADAGLELAEDAAVSEASMVEAVAEPEVPAAVMELLEAGDTLELVEDAAVSEPSMVEAVAELEAPAAVMELVEAGDTLELVEDAAVSDASVVEAAIEPEVPAAVMELAEAGDTLELAEDAEASEVSMVEPVAEPEVPAAVMELAEAGDTLELVEDTVVSEASMVEAAAELEVPAGVMELAEAGDTLEPVEDAAVSEASMDASIGGPETTSATLEPVQTEDGLAAAEPASAATPVMHFELEPSASDLAAPVEPVVKVVAGQEAAADSAALDFQVLDLELVDIFVEEGKDLLDHCDGLLAELRSNPDDREAVAGLQRDLHTLKGGARMAGINPVGDLAHTVESLLEAVVAERLELGAGEVRLLENGFDHLHRMVTRTGEHLRVELPVALVQAFEARTHGLDLQVEQASVVSHEATQGRDLHEPAAEIAAVADQADMAAVVVEEAAELPAVVEVEVEAEAEAEAEGDAIATQAAPVGRVITIAGVLDEHDELDGQPAPDLSAGTVQAEASAAAPAASPYMAVEEPAAVAASSAIAQAPAPSAVAVEPLSAPVDDDAAAGEEGAARAGQEQVRVRADLLDRLVGHAGEVAIYRSRLEQQLGAFRGAMAELDRTNARLRDQLRRLDLETEAQIVARYQREQDSADRTFDPLELDRFSTLQQLSRALNESAADLSGLQGVLDDLARNYDNLLSQQSRVSSELQDGLMRARMVPFDGLVPRLRRVVRQAAADSGKSVRLVVEGTQGELDRSVLDRMVAPLEHMLRNSVAHGIETAPVRLAAGKPEEGVITLQLRREGSEIALEVTDDGAGLDRSAIRRRAEQRGLIQADEALSGHELDALIFAAGFTTADQVSQLAGRGVGMDVVRNEVRQLGGSVDVHSESGRGARFVMRLPQTLAVTQAVFAQIGETTYAVPVASVSGIGRIARERFENGDGIYRYGGEEYALYDLGLLVGQGPAKAEGQAQVPLLLVRAGDLRAAVAIDQVVGNREVVVKPVGMQIASVPGIYGATITGEGNVVVILDVAPLVRRLLNQPSRTLAVAPVVPVRQVPLVMVVDDSLTMRKVTGRVLERHNFEVSAARDGIEALEQLEERVPDLMLLDIEMPRMDGYELATAMRADPRYKDVPIIMITSRTGDKHRQRALEIGVQRYLGKPYQEPELMRNVYDLLGISRARD